MLAQATQHPDMIDWEVDEDVRRARMIVRAHMRKEDSFLRVGGDLSAEEVNPYLPPRAPHIRINRAVDTNVAPTPTTQYGKGTVASFRESEHATHVEIDEYPRSAQGGWRPWIFALTGFVGGNLAMTLGGISPNYLPTIIVAEIILGILVCFAFYPRHATA